MDRYVIAVFLCFSLHFGPLGHAADPACDFKPLSHEDHADRIELLESAKSLEGKAALQRLFFDTSTRVTAGRISDSERLDGIGKLIARWRAMGFHPKEFAFYRLSRGNDFANFRLTLAKGNQHINLTGTLTKPDGPFTAVSADADSRGTGGETWKKVWWHERNWHFEFPAEDEKNESYGDAILSIKDFIADKGYRDVEKVEIMRSAYEWSVKIFLKNRILMATTEGGHESWRVRTYEAHGRAFTGG